jgi:hypothetical protein
MVPSASTVIGSLACLLSPNNSSCWAIKSYSMAHCPSYSSMHCDLTDADIAAGDSLGLIFAWNYEAPRSPLEDPSAIVKSCLFSFLII